MTIFLILVVVGIAVAIWLIPMPVALRNVLIGMAIFLFVVWALMLFGLINGPAYTAPTPTIRVP